MPKLKKYMFKTAKETLRLHARKFGTGLFYKVRNTKNYDKTSADYLFNTYIDSPLKQNK